jgi:septum formation protein
MLRSLGLTFEAIASGVEEGKGEGEAPSALARRWAGEKAEAVSGAHPDRWVLSADTIVVLGGAVFGKPSDSGAARSMLEQLKGRTHEVWSGVCLMRGRPRANHLHEVRTRVTFRDFSPEEIEAYIASGEPFDKAGAYGIQGMGASLVRSISGSYTNVVGLPLCETIEWLLREGIIAPNRS